MKVKVQAKSFSSSPGKTKKTCKIKFWPNFHPQYGIINIKLVFENKGQYSTNLWHSSEPKQLIKQNIFFTDYQKLQKGKNGTVILFTRVQELY